MNDTDRLWYDSLLTEYPVVQFERVTNELLEMRRNEILASGNITEAVIEELAEIEVALCKS